MDEYRSRDKECQWSGRGGEGSFSERVRLRASQLKRNGNSQSWVGRMMEEKKRTSILPEDFIDDPGCQSSY